MKTDDALGHKANLKSQQISKNQYHDMASQLSQKTSENYNLKPPYLYTFKTHDLKIQKQKAVCGCQGLGVGRNVVWGFMGMGFSWG